MKKTVNTILPILFLYFIISCSSSTEPEDELGRRDYVWTADTLKLPAGESVSISGIWGANANDVWVCGRASFNKYRLWHYDGLNWSTVEVGFSISDAFALFGFDSNNVWLATTLGQVAYYNGLEWKSLGDFSNENEILVLEGMWGRNRSELYAFGFWDKRDMSGYRGCIMMYDGTKWSFLNIENLSMGFSTMGFDDDINKYFLHSYTSQTGNQGIYELKGNTLIKLYESKEETKVFNMDGKVYFRVGKKILKYGHNGIFIWKDFSNDPQYVGAICGRNEKDLFVGRRDGIAHFNGDNIELLYSTDWWGLGSKIFERDLFIVCWDIKTRTTIILHGKLK